MPTNQPPVIRGISCDPCQIAPGGRALVAADVVYDSENDNLTVIWDAFPKVGSSSTQPGPDRFHIYYVANFEMEPGQTAVITITLEVIDEGGGNALGSIQIQVTSPSEGN
jgi:hypothetical protein